MKQFVFFVLSIFMAHTACVAQTSEQPNILVIISDDHAYQTIGAYGSPLTQTPGIDRLAKEGALFTNAYVTNSLCGPSRATFLSGRYSHMNGFKDNDHSTFDFNQDIFVKRLQAAGYQTAWIGKMHLGENTPQGFDYYNILPGQGEYYNPDFIATGGTRTRHEGYVTNIITTLSENWLDQRNPSKPFCLVVGHKATHRTWMPDLQDLGAFDNQTFPLPATFYDTYATRKAAQQQDMTIAKTLQMDYDLKIFPSREEESKMGAIQRMTPEQRAQWDAYYDNIKKDFEARKLNGNALTEWKYQRYIKDYLATARSLDRNISALLKYLDDHDLSKNTIVIYMSDQGFYMGEHGWFDKRWMYEESFRTPMVMRYPGIIKPGTKINDYIMNLDLAPTLLQAGKATVPAAMQGMSFLPLLKGQAYTSRKAMYYHYYENTVHHVSPQFGIKTGRYKLIRYYERVEAWELFDLQKDPQELKNVYPDKQYTKIVTGLKRQLLQLIEQYKDADAKKIFLSAVIKN
ncbi:sulfatase [Niabella ginsenosidivorans]|uniref:Sulfatase n=1 Tax=Niabella ginsenosidivorans TaxID=1176587 RepID=A0A1A9I824_9BACT|nr:sulfatase [Niabella ginsenosidivorans]ANH82831.1 sulfatase [Niabella ginsenosidivorans]